MEVDNLGKEFSLFKNSIYEKLIDVCPTKTCDEKVIVYDDEIRMWLREPLEIALNEQ